MTPKPTSKEAARSIPVLPIKHRAAAVARQKDTAVQSKLAAPNMPSPGLNFEGIDYPGVSCFCAPPDPNGEVGDTQYVQIVNEALEVFDKNTGASVLGPESIETLWSGFGGPCQSSAAGDPVVLYDQLAKRWVVSQLALSPPSYECVAVSTSDNATGTWNRYAFNLGGTFGQNFYDYPKLGVWPDAYYLSFNIFNASGTAFLGPQPFALDRSAMLAGDPAAIISTGVLSPNDDQLMPADMDGSIPPPPGAPNPYTEIGTNPTWTVWRFHVDFTTPNNSTFTQAGTLTPDPFQVICPDSGGTCVPQAGVDDQLDTLGDRSMFRNAYRRFPDGHEALVGNMTVESNGVAGIRWWEIDNATSGTPGFVQQSTYQPDDTWRWMGSAAMDASGDIALGFSASSSAINPQIRYAGRLATDPPNTLAQGEAHLFDGTGSQTDYLSRWGDYSDLTVDPTDDCTFWYTNEYLQTTGSFNWRTRIGNFKFPSCAKPPSGTLSGTVTDSSTQKPIAGAEVDTQFGSTTTDDNGNYSLSLPVGTYDVTFSAFGHVTHTENNVAITDGATTTLNVALQLSPLVTVSGTITDGSGHGWPLYARFSVKGDPNGPFFTDPVTGKYSIQLPANGSYTLTFTSQLPGYQVVQQTVTVGGSDMTHDVAIPVSPDCTAPGYSTGSPCLVAPGGLVEGNAFDLNTGDAINGAAISSDDKPTDRATTFATPDDANNPDGFYWLFSSLTGSHTFTAAKSGYSSATETVNVAADGTVRQDFSLGTAHLTISQTSISSTQQLGSTATKTLSFHNDGTGVAHVELSEGNGSFQVLGPQGGNAPSAAPDAKTAAAPDAPGWASAAPVPAGIADYAHAQCPDQPNSFYVISGSSNGFNVRTNYRYDAASNSWTTLAPIPGGNASPSAVCLDDKIYVTGNTGTWFIYDIASNTWSTGAPVPHHVAGAAAGALDGKVYLVTGDDDFNATNGVFDGVQVYDVATNTWSTGSPIPVGAYTPGSVQVGQYLYVVGGLGPSGPLSATQRYDMSTDTWQTGPTFTPAKAAFALAATNAALYAMGGQSGGQFNATASTYRLDLTNWPDGTWQDLSDPIPAPRNSNYAGFCTTFLTGGEIWSVGGLDSTFNYTNDAFYRPTPEGCPGVDVPWLNETPSDFDVPVGGTVKVTIALSATTRATVTQPGTYTAQLALTTNAPQTFDPIDVTMHVTPPPNWGKVVGTVTGTDCDGTNNPLDEATLQAIGHGAGISLSVKTDAGGKYALWGPAAADPFSVTASKNGWTAQTAKVNIIAKKTLTVNFNLHPATC